MFLSLPPSSSRAQQVLRMRELELQLFLEPLVQSATLRSVFAAFPSYPFNPTIYSPARLEEIERVREEERKEASATLEVKSHLERTAIHLDGLEHLANGDKARRVALISGGVAVVSTGVAVALAYLSREPEPFAVHF